MITTLKDKDEKENLVLKDNLRYDKILCSLTPRARLSSASKRVWGYLIK